MPRDMSTQDSPDLIQKEGSDFHTALTTLRGQHGQVRGPSPLPYADLHFCPNGLYVNWLI
jgi:hypothetical protein